MPGAWWAVALAAVGLLLIFRGGQAFRWLGIGLLGAASLRLVVWESYPDLFGNTFAPAWLRVFAYLVTIGGWYGAARAVGRERRQYWPLLLAANLLTVWWITFEITLAFVDNHAVPSAHEGLLVAAAWSLYGLGLALVERRRPHSYLRMAARVMVSAGLIFLMAGALTTNARWGLAPYRFFTYASVLGSAWATDAMFGRPGYEPELHGLIGLTAMGCGFIIASFEVTRWLEPVFTFPQHMLRSQASFDWEAAIRANWQMIAWGLYSVAATAGAVVARSARGRLLAGVLALITLVAGVYGALQTGAPLTLRLPALAAAAGGTALSAWLAGRGDGPQLREEPWLRRALWIGSGGLVLVWAALNLI